MEYFSSDDANKLFRDKFIFLIEERFTERFPDAFLKCHTLDPEIYKKANPSMYSYYIKIVASMSSIYKVTGVGKYRQTEEEFMNSDYSFFRRMYEDFQVTDDPIGWLVEYVTLNV